MIWLVRLAVISIILSWIFLIIGIWTEAFTWRLAGDVFASISISICIIIFVLIRRDKRSKA